MARQRNNIYAMAADAVDLALDTAGTMGSIVGSMANLVGIGGSKEKTEAQSREEAGDAADRVAASLTQETELAKTSLDKVNKVAHKGLHKVKARAAHKPASKARHTVSKAAPRKSAKKVVKQRTARTGRTARKVA